MYLLDTNVISELRRAIFGKADRRVSAWANSVPASSLYLSAITVLVLEVGALLSKRKDPLQGERLQSWIDQQVLPAFSNRILPVDVTVAKYCASLHVPNPKADRDALIAATAIIHGMSVITRNVRDFKDMGVKLINPWELTKPTSIRVRLVSRNRP